MPAPPPTWRTLTCPSPGVSICDILEFGGCQGYAYDPPCGPDDEPGETTWDVYDYATPALDGAPWYNANYPQSADAIGFFIEEWTGLDNRHVERKVAGRHLGGQLGALGATERVMKLNLLAFARSERAMEYLFRWLEATLSTVCASCETSSMWIRRWCPTISPTCGTGLSNCARSASSKG